MPGSPSFVVFAQKCSPFGFKHPIKAQRVGQKQSTSQIPRAYIYHCGGNGLKYSWMQAHGLDTRKLAFIERGLEDQNHDGFDSTPGCLVLN
jgi:hypothetical protein